MLKKTRNLVLLCMLVFASAALCAAQQPKAEVHRTSSAAPAPPDSSGAPDSMPDMDMGDMPGMSAPASGKMPPMHPRSFLEEIEHHATSGTSAEPNSTPASMLMSQRGPWMLMFHASLFLDDIQQTSPRGADKLFSTNWFMPMAQRTLGPGLLTLRAMFSLEPATITGERYPLLFQQGETAYGLPIADGQHPHNLVMELAALYDLRLAPRTLLSLYAAPAGDPAIGPIAYPHRASAAEDPVATLGHHQQDSTHISYDVVTAGLTYRIARVEASGFHGREPDEHRWKMQQGSLDSWSTRITLQPGQNWSGQYSYARIASPEALSPAENQSRSTASLMYNRPLAKGNWTSTAVWGRTRSIPQAAAQPNPRSSKENSYLIESSLRFANRNYFWTRIENAGRTSELLIGEHPLPTGFDERPLTHVQAYTLGYSRDLPLVPHLASALGAQVTLYGVDRPLQPVYGSDPIGLNLFLRLRPISKN